MNTPQFTAVVTTAITLLTLVAYAPATNYTRIFAAGIGTGIALCILILLVANYIANLWERKKHANNHPSN